MARILYGKPLADEMAAALAERARRLASSGVTPCLAVVRVGGRSDDIAYESSIAKRADSVGISLRRVVVDDGVDGCGGLGSGLGDGVINGCGAGLGSGSDGSVGQNNSSEKKLLAALRELAADPGVHGILLFRPLPSGMDEALALAAIPAEKDVDGVTQTQMAALYSMKKIPPADAGGNIFFPCTAEAAVRLLDYWKVPVAGKSACVVGRSTVIGKPAAHLLLAQGATVTVCHSGTPELAAATRGADIVVAAAGLARGGRGQRMGAEYFSAGQAVVDVAVNADGDGLYGDVDTEAALEAVSAAGVGGVGERAESGGAAGDGGVGERAENGGVGVACVGERAGRGGAAGGVSPVPGGLGAVTTLVLMEHVIRSAEMAGIHG
ncbi:MAG: bifunctional 5,10-methylenetetrahydrofolate dehydrogenase/5,10-methenyltetrahydrofolate cyclohydrolase [Clostridiales Family XIII bacterium]|jgi:methylenetetrahydrofolate dehydrogenase (NADP+)/methenyltetrahydrofolate cyclohydrolase|nr:bifunctional 5,10-methylenetetrahydrofolate dehydrogenase/5,10-methenyltetrahydrofolate cyclohydrolase [Clostridiales Family XIII bacterium]